MGCPHEDGCRYAIYCEDRCRDRREIKIPPLLPDQVEYLRKIQDATGKYDPKKMVGGPNKRRPR